MVYPLKLAVFVHCSRLVCLYGILPSIDLAPNVLIIAYSLGALLLRWHGAFKEDNSVAEKVSIEQKYFILSIRIDIKLKMERKLKKID